MNQSLYRIVFNKARGCMMAVSELASSNAKGKDKSQSASGASSRSARSSATSEVSEATFGFSKPILKAINSLVLLSLVIPSLTAPLGAYAQVRSDPNAPGNERPTILNSANGLTQVNIQSPSAQGVSRNKYDQFDVDNRGIIINNSRTNTQTQQGGLVQGNPWLAKGSARIIVNEINSSNPSYLNGYIEIAGQRAEIVIANPAGISVNGGGFINASSATLTTGSPIINGGSLEGYAVQKGTISINGYGLDASLTDYTGILARAVEVNAGIWANNLQIVTGANQISADQSTSTPIAGIGGAPAFALDVSNLGGMYAGKITLIGTEAGLGVRNAGYIGAAGDLSINSEGILINSGLLNSSANANISVKGSVDNSGSISAIGNASIDSAGEILNSGGISAGANLGLSSASTIKNSGNLSADGNLSMTSASGINNSGQVYATGNTSLKTGGDILNSGMVAAQGNTTLTSTAVGGSITNSQSSILAAGMTPDGQILNTGNLSLEADRKISTQGLLIAGNQLSVKSNSLDLSGTNLATGALSLTATGGDLNLAGAKVSVAREFDLTAAQTLATDSAVISAQALTIDAAKWTNIQGQVLQLGEADTNIKIAGELNNTEGFIASNGQNLSIKAAAINNNQAGILHAGNGQLTVATGKLGLTEGQITSNGDLSLVASQIDGSKGALISKGAMLTEVIGDVNLAGGQVNAGKELKLSAASLNISSGQLTSQEKLAVQVSGAFDNSDALTASSSSVSLNTGALNNNKGTIVGNALDINTNGKALSSVSGTIASGTSLTLSSGALNNDAGSIQSAGNMVLNTNGQTLTNTGGDAATGKGILSQGTLAINAGDLNSSAGYLAAAGKISIDAKNVSNAAAGIMVSGDVLSINASGDFNNAAGQIQAANKVDITTLGNLDSTKGLIASGAQLDLNVGKTLTTDAGVVSTAALGIKATDWRNVKGQTIQTGNTDTNINIAGELNNTEGFIASNGQNLSIKAAAINNNQAGILHAGNGQLTVATGKLGLTEGQITSNGDLSLVASQIDGSKGALISKGAMLTEVIGDVNLAGGQVNAGKELKLSAASLNISSGQLTSQEKLAVQVSGAFDNSDALTASSSSVSLNTGALNNNKGTIVGNALDINTNGKALSSVSGTIASGTSLTLSSGALNNDAGSIQSAGNMVLNTNGQTLTNTGGDAATGKGILSQGTLAINAGDLNSSAGYLAAAGKISIDAKNVSNAAAGIMVSGDVLSINASGDFNNAAGQIQAAKALTIDIGTGALDNTQGLISSSADVDIKTGSLVNKNTKVESLVNKLDPDTGLVVNDAAGNPVKVTKLDIKGIQAKSVNITTGAIDNSQGGIIATDALVITGTGSLNNAQGILVSSSGKATITSLGLNNTSGVIQSTLDLEIKAGTGVLDNTQGLIATSAALDIKAGSIVNKNTKTETITDKLDANGQPVIDLATDKVVKETKLDIKGIQAKSVKITTGAIDNSQGGIIATDALVITGTGSLNNAQGILVSSSGTATITSLGLNNTGGVIQSTLDLKIKAGTGVLDNTQGLIASSADVDITAGSLVNKNTKVESLVNKLDPDTGLVVNDAAGNPVKVTKLDIKGVQAKKVVLTTGTIDNTDGGILAGETLAIVGTGALNNTKGMLAASETATIAATDVNNSQGVIQSTKALTIDVGTGTLDNTQGLVASSAALEIKAASLINKNTKIETITDKLDDNGQPVIDLATGNVTKKTVYDIKGIQAKSVKITTGTIDNTQGGIIATGDQTTDTLTINATGSLNNTQGMLASSTTATITSLGLNNTGGVIQSTQDLKIKAGTGVLDNTQGLIASSADADINAGSLVNKNTKVESIVNKLDPDTKLVVKDKAGNVIKETKLDIKGIQAKNVILTTGAIDNTDGGILASETLAIIGTGALNNTKGMLAASEEATIVATSLNNTQGTIQSAKALTVDVGTGTLNNTQGLVASSTDVTVIASSILNANTKTESMVDKIDPLTDLPVKDAAGVVVKVAKIDIKGIQGKTITLNANNVDNTEGGILAVDSLLIKGSGVVNNTKGLISSTGDVMIKDTVAVDDPAPAAAGTPAPTTPPPDTNIATKTQTVINTGGAIVANKKLIIDSKSLTGDGNVLNAGLLVDIMQDAAGKQVKKNAAGKWVTLDANGVPCTTNCTELTDTQVSVRMIDKEGVLLKKNASGQYVKVNADGTEILVNGAAVVVAEADASKAKEMTEGDVTIKLVDSYNQASTGSIQASGNLDMRTKADVTNLGVIQASRALTLQAENIDNKFGGEISAGATQLAANNSITNRGLIDGSFTLLQANEITNTGTGRIYGDQISVLAGSLTNSAEGAKSAVIAARGNMDIGAYVISNSDDSLLLSLGNMTVGKTLDANGKATGQAEAFINSSATVEVIGNLNVSAKSLNNIDGYAVSGSNTTTEDVVEYTIIYPGQPNTGTKFNGKDGTFKDWNNDPNNPEYAMFYSTLSSNLNDWHTAIGSSLEWSIEKYTHVTTTTGTYGTKPATISVGGNMTTDFVDGVNDKSKIIVGGSLTGNGDNFQNIGSYGTSRDSEINGTAQRTWVKQRCNLFGCTDTRIYDPITVRTSTDITDNWQVPSEILYNTVPTYSGTVVDNRKDVSVIATQPGATNAKAVAGQGPATYTNTLGTGTVRNSDAIEVDSTIGSVTTTTRGAGAVGINNTIGSGTAVHNADKVTSGTTAGGVSVNNTLAKASAPSSAGKVVRSSNSTKAQLPNNSLYIIQPVDSNGAPKGYLVETDPRFTQNKLWLGSDYMLKQMGYDPATQTKRLGDGFYEQKLIREQIAELTGRRFLDNNGEQYTNDEEQYKALMNAGIQFALDYGVIPGVALTPEQMAKLTTDIVWLVAKEVTLPDGSKTTALVPQVYALVKPGDIDGSGNLLSAKSIDLKLKGDMVNSGLMAARGNLSIDAANITNLTGTLKGVDVSLVASQDIQSIQGNIIAGNNLKISAGNDVVIKAGNVSAGGNASISAGHDLLILAQEKGRQVSANWGKLKKDKDGKDIPGVYENNDNSLKYGTYDQTGANISVGGGLSMSAGNDFYAQGTQINAGSISVSAGRDATITNAQKGSFYESSLIRKEKTWGGLGSKTTTHITRNTDITNIETNWNAGNIGINAGRDLTIVGGNFNAAGGINLGAGNNVNVMAAYDIKEKVSINAVKNNDFGRLMSTLNNGVDFSNIKGGAMNEKATDTSTTDIDSTRTAKLVTLNGGAGGVNISAGNTINLEAPKISGSSLNVNAGTTNPDGKINLIAAIDSREVSRTVTSRNTFWQSNQSIGTLNQTLHMTQVNVPVGASNFQGAGGISVQLPKGAKLPQQIATLAKQPGNEYLTDLAKRSDIDWKQVEVINKTWDYKKQGITQETAIVVAIVVTIVTAGVASGAGAAMATAAGESVAVAATATTAAVAGTTAGAVIAGATSAAITTLATQAAIALLNNKGDISGALKELGSKENLKGLATAMITAGLVQGIGVQFGLDQINAKSPFINQLGANLVNGVAGSLVSTAINGGNLETNLKNAIKTALISTAGAQLANGIGNITNDNQLSQTDIEKFANKFAHAVLGCAIGAATADSKAGCGAGALGAVAGSLGAELFDPANSKGAQAQQFGKLTAALAVLLVGGNANLMNIAGTTAVNAVANNRQLHPVEADLIKQNAARYAKEIFKTENPTPEQIEAATIRLVNTAQNLLDNNTGFNIDSYKSAENFLQTLKIDYSKQNGTLVLPDTQGTQQLFYATVEQKNQPLLNAGLADPKITGLIVRTPLNSTINKADDPTRDRLTGLPLDDKGRYTLQITLDGKNLSPKFFSCATAECISGGYNLDMSDPGTQTYVKVLQKTVMDDINKGATVATIFFPVGAAGNLLQTIGPATSIASGILDDQSLKAIFKEGLQAAAGKYFQKVYGFSEALANRVVATVDLAGGWQAFVDRVQQEKNKVGQK
jgi:filamentous hemagglutinin